MTELNERNADWIKWRSQAQDLAAADAAATLPHPPTRKQSALRLLDLSLTILAGTTVKAREPEERARKLISQELEEARKLFRKYGGKRARRSVVRRRKEYNPDQPRDELGRFGETGGGDSSAEGSRALNELIQSGKAQITGRSDLNQWLNKNSWSGYISPEGSLHARSGYMSHSRLVENSSDPQTVLMLMEDAGWIRVGGANGELFVTGMEGDERPQHPSDRQQEQIQRMRDFADHQEGFHFSTEGLKSIRRKQHGGHVTAEGVPHEGHGGAGSSREGYQSLTHGGVKLLIKEGMDSRDQRLTANDVKSAVDTIPEKFRDAVPPIRLTDEILIDDDGGVNPSAAASMVHEAPPEGSRSNMDTANEIVLWSAAGDAEPETFQGMIRHEVGHKIMPNTEEFRSKWQTASEADGAYISDYAKTSVNEDFAETVRSAWSLDSAERRSIERFFPARYALMQELGIVSGTTKEQARLSSPLKIVALYDKDGKPVGEAVVLSGKRKQVEATGPTPLSRLIEEASRLLRELTDDLEAGDITPDMWEDEFERILARYHTAGLMLGAGEDALTATSAEYLAALIGSQFSYLANFGVDIQDAEEWQAGFAQRAESYAAAIKVPYWSGETEMLPLPAMPAEGTQCLNNCGCSWDIEELDADKGDYDCYWVRSKDDSCQTCIEREAQWSPFRIRAFRAGAQETEVE